MAILPGGMQAAEDWSFGRAGARAEAVRGPAARRGPDTFRRKYPMTSALISLPSRSRKEPV